MKTNPQLSSSEGTNAASGQEKRKIHIARKKTAHFNFLFGAGGFKSALTKASVSRAVRDII